MLPQRSSSRRKTKVASCRKASSGAPNLVGYPFGPRQETAKRQTPGGIRSRPPGEDHVFDILKPRPLPSTWRFAMSTHEMLRPPSLVRDSPAHDRHGAVRRSCEHPDHRHEAVGDGRCGARQHSPAIRCISAGISLRSGLPRALAGRRGTALTDGWQVFAQGIDSLTALFLLMPASGDQELTQFPPRCPASCGSRGAT